MIYEYDLDEVKISVGVLDGHQSQIRISHTIISCHFAPRREQFSGEKYVRGEKRSGRKFAGWEASFCDLQQKFESVWLVSQVMNQKSLQRIRTNGMNGAGLFPRRSSC